MAKRAMPFYNVGLRGERLSLRPPIVNERSLDRGRRGRLSVQASLMVILLLAASRVASSDPVTASGRTTHAVAIDVQAVNSPHFARYQVLRLQQKLALRLTQAGFAVLSPTRRPVIALFLKASHRGLVLRVASRRFSNTREIPRAEGPIDSFHLEVMHKAIEAVRQIARAVDSLRAHIPVESQSDPELPPGLARTTTPSPVTWSHLELHSSAMAIFRSQAADLQLRGDLLWRVWSALHLRLSGFFSPSRAQEGIGTEGDLRLWVREWGIQVGAAWRLRVASTIHADLGALLGLLYHDYTAVDPGGSTRQGARQDVLANLTASLAWRPHPRFSVQLWISPGFTGEREHRLELPGAAGSGKSTSLWLRPAVRLETGGGVALGLY
jgi:hypothetical protein